MRIHVLLLTLSPISVVIGFSDLWFVHRDHTMRLCAMIVSAGLIWSYTIIQLSHGPLGIFWRVLMFLSGPTVMVLACFRYGHWTDHLATQMQGGAIIATSLIVCAALLQAAAVRARAEPKLTCRHCEYDLTGQLKELRCSECGRPQR